ncbi:MAG: lysophospholipid acyltransferase family protein, partial [Bdellovibrionota bacterium]
MLEKILHTNLSDVLMDQLAELIRAYFRVELEGLENIPKEGGALIVPNHSGFSGADAIMICHLIHHDLGRTPRILAHRGFFEWFESVRRLSLQFGLEEVSVDHGAELLRRRELVLIFPEGESGNFKSSLKRYRLQHFHTGFVRMAIQTQVPIIPCLVTGAEESHLTLGSLNLSRFVKGLRLPIPLNLVPLPAKWKIQFLKPIVLD